MQATTPSDREIVLTRTFAAPLAAVFDALTQAKHLVHWMNPTNESLVGCEVDLRAGGSFRYVFQRPGGAKIEVRGAFEAVDPPRRVVYTEAYDFSPLEVRVTTALEPSGGETVFKQTIAYASKRERDDDLDGVVTSALEAYDALERYLGSASCCPVLELRQYTLHPGARETLVRLFEEHFIESQERVGMRVVGQFRDIERPDRFVWIRGFDGMEARRRALEAFYGGPVWNAHKGAANATMVDSDNVLLLRPAAGAKGLPFEPRLRAPAGAPEAAGGVVVVTIHYFDRPVDEAFTSWFRGEAIPVIAGAGIPVLAQLVTEPAPNTFRLPVREGVNVFAWLSAFPDEPSRLASFRRLEERAEWKSRIAPRLAAVTTGTPERLLLAPTPRSALRYRDPAVEAR